MSAPDNRINVAVRLLSKTTDSVTYVQYLGPPEYERVAGEVSSSRELVVKRCDNRNWRRLAIRVHGAGLFPIEDARIQYVLRVRSTEVAKFFTGPRGIKRRYRLDDEHLPDVYEPQLVDMGINCTKSYKDSPRNFEFYALNDELRNFLINAFQQTPLDAAALEIVINKQTPNSAWSTQYKALTARARLAIHIKDDKVTKTSRLAELTETSNEPRRRLFTNSLKRRPLTFDPCASSLEVWLRKVTAYTFGGNATFGITSTPLSSLVADPLRTLALTADMSAPYERTYGRPWCDDLKAAARSFLQKGVGDFGLAKGRACVFAAPRGEHAPPQYAVKPRVVESMSYHKAGETTCWRHPMLFDTKTVDVSTDARDVHALRDGAGLAVKAAMMADCEWMLLRSPDDSVNLHRPGVALLDKAIAGVKTRMRFLDRNSNLDSERIFTIDGDSVGENRTFSCILDGGSSVDSCTHAMFLNVRAGEYVGLPVAAAIIMSRACANKPQGLMDAAYVRADGADFGEADARAAALLAAFFNSVGIMVPDVRDDDISAQAAQQREHNARVVRIVGDAVEELRRKLTHDDMEDDDEKEDAGDGATDWVDVARVAKRQRRV